jgi:hypothetical protein
VIFAAMGLAFVFSSAALAGTTSVTIDSRSPALVEAEGGGWTAALGFTNLTNTEITLTAEPSNAADGGCILTLDHPQLPAAEHSEVEVIVPAGCRVGEDGVDFTVSSTTSTPTPLTFEVTAAPKPDTKPEWSALWAFVIFLLILLAAAGIYLALIWLAPNTELTHLDATWSFGDSWVSNVTVLGGLLAGIFGSSEVVTALLGDDAGSSVALAIVGAAVAAAVISAGAIVLLATKSKNDFVTVGGFLLASALTLSGAAGELWVVYRSGQRLDLGGWEDEIVWMAVAGFVLLGFYAIRTIPATIRIGTTQPEEPGPSDTIKAAKMIVAALKAQERFDADSFEDALRELSGTQVAATPRPRRSGLL